MPFFKGSYSPKAQPPPPCKECEKRAAEDKAKASSALSIPHGTAKDKVKDKNKDKREKSYSKQQIEKWTSSINSLLTDEEGVNAFEIFLGEAETEPLELKRYLLFYRECNSYRIKMKELEEEATRIYETYLEVGSDLEIGTGGKGEEVGKKIDEEGFPQKTLFDASQKKVKDKMDEGLYVNFCQYLKEKYKL